MELKVLAPLVMGIGAMFAIGASTTSGDSPPAQSAATDASLAYYAELVKETELRRRVNVLYPNPQSIFDGIQVGYVSVRRGNLTFRRRDIVAGPRGLTHFSRVYDSRSNHGRDFGPGWRLSLAEELTLVDGDLVYTDGSGARHSFKLTSSNQRSRHRESLLSGQQVQINPGGTHVMPLSYAASGTYTADPATPQHAATTIEVLGPLAVLRDGQATRIFEQGAAGAHGAYLLSSITSGNNETVALSYRNGRIRTISDAAGVVFSVTRSHSGRIVSVQDRWGREVHYGYDASGRLQETQDIAGHTWRYEYTPHGWLTRAIGPNNRDILRIRYDGAGRVEESLSGRQYSFTYAQGETIVAEGTGHSHVFGQNATGITDRFDSTNGGWWQLKLDERNRVVEAHSASGAYQYAYGREGRIRRVVEQLPEGLNNREFQYDANGRITGTYSQDGAFTTVDYSGRLTRIGGAENPLEFDVTESGRIGHVRQNSVSIEAQYDGEGNLASLGNDANAVEFGRDSMGRLSDVRYANGEVNRYGYDDLGNRAWVDFGMGGAVRYMHDPSGNIVEVVVTEISGEQKRQVVQIGDMNRVESIDYEGAGTLGIGYDRMGRAVSFEMGDEAVSVEYEGPDRIARIVSTINGATWSPNDDGESGPSERTVMDARLEVIQSDSLGASHPDYGIVGFDDVTFGMTAVDPMELSVPGLRQARQLLRVAEPLFADDEYGPMMDFEKPSNPVFQPLEYRSTNCCIGGPSTAPRAISPGGGASRPGSRGSHSSYCTPTDSSPSLSIITKPKIWHIDNNLKMPNIQFIARLDNVDDSVLKPRFFWTLEMEFDHESRTFEHRRAGVTTIPRWSPNWGRLLAGANDMTLTVIAKIGNLTLTASEDGYEIHGENPTQEQIFGIATRLEHKAVCWQESTHRQFEDTRYTGIDIPLWGKPDGWGLMQLEISNPDKTWGEDEVWNWRDNLSEGVQYLGEIYAQAKGYLDEHHRLASESIETADDWPSNPADDENNVWDDTFARYLTGRTTYSRNGNKGQKNCQANSAGCNYATAVRGHMNNTPWE